jgi:2-isopropylmalate synthase
MNKAVVGINAFSHEAGIHQHGVMVRRDTYEILSPESIGRPAAPMILGKHSGRHAVEKRLSELGYRFTIEETDHLFGAFKALADKKRQVSDHDLEALIGHSADEVGQGYSLTRFTVNSGNYIRSSAVVSLTKGGNSYEDVAMGEGPIDAAFRAVDRITGINGQILDNYSIHSVTEGKDALGEVVVKLKKDGRTVTGRGLSTDILEASLLAYINGVNKLL